MIVPFPVEGMSPNWTKAPTRREADIRKTKQKLYLKAVQHLSALVVLSSMSPNWK